MTAKICWQAGITPQAFPGKLQKELMHTVLSGHLPENFPERRFLSISWSI
jgi:hypothetical protein